MKLIPDNDTTNLIGLKCTGVRSSKKLLNHRDQWFKYLISFYQCIFRGINNLRFGKNNFNKKHLYENNLIDKSLKSQWRKIGLRVMVLTLTRSYNPSHFYYESVNTIYRK